MSPHCSINKLIKYYNSIDKENINFSVKSYFTIKEFDYESIILETKYLFIEPNPVETQALWHTPNLVFNYYNESNKEGIIKFLKDVAETGFNRIYLETNEVGTSYYNSSILKPHEIFLIARLFLNLHLEEDLYFLSIHYNLEI